MFIDDKTRLLHMREFASEVMHFVSLHGRADLDTDVFVARGLVRTLETIGEAASRVSHNFRDAHPEILWRKWTLLRNHLVHDYHSYDYDRVWQVAAEDMEPLVAALDPLIAEL